MRFPILILMSGLALGLGSLLGCAKDGSGEVVEGKVTFAGQPLGSGHIDFIPVDGKGPASGGEIKNGQYQFKIVVGPKRVNITADKVTGQQKAYPNDPNSPVFDIKEQYLPNRYNTNSELKRDVVSGKNTFDFDLTVDAAK